MRIWRQAGNLILVILNLYCLSATLEQQCGKVGIEDRLVCRGGLVESTNDLRFSRALRIGFCSRSLLDKSGERRLRMPVDLESLLGTTCSNLE